MTPKPPHSGWPFLPKFLGVIMVLFIGILIATYLIAREADPVILDDHGNYRSGGHGSAR
jgi:hypothetical protein